MLRSIVEKSPFGALLGIATFYALGAMSGVILIADALARVPVLWPHLVP
jgi:hypothetical protein